MKDDYFEGKCHICRNETQCRWKNIYHMGSEGLDICWNCEKQLLDFIDELKRKNHKRIIEERRNKYV